MNKALLPDNIVIYVDDDPDDRELVRDAFYKHVNKVEMLCFGSGNEALSYLAETTADRMPCLIILDVNMPKLNGRQTLLRIKQNDQLSNVPLVLFSTSSDPRDKEFAKRNGASYVVKPFSYENLKSVVQWFIDQCAVH